MNGNELLVLAQEAMMKAYAPYSGVFVGAALLTAGGKVYTGCNVENAAYSPSNCAERTAFFKAVSEGERAFTAIAIVGGKGGKIRDFFPPCGVCRQVMLEFCKEDFKIFLTDGKEVRELSLRELTPYGFTSDKL